MCMSRKVSLVGHTWCPGFVFLWSPQFGWVWCIWTTARKGLVHLVSTCHVALVQCWLDVHLGWRDRLSTPNSIGYLFMSRGFIGGRGIARPPSSSHPRCVPLRRRGVPRGRKDWHLSPPPPHNVKEFSGGRGTSPPPYCRLVPRREGQAFSLTTTVTTSEEEGQALLLTMSVSSSEVQSWHRWDAPAIP